MGFPFNALWFSNISVKRLCQTVVETGQFHFLPCYHGLDTSAMDLAFVVSLMCSIVGVNSAFQCFVSAIYFDCHSLSLQGKHWK